MLTLLRAGVPNAEILLAKGMPDLCAPYLGSSHSRPRPLRSLWHFGAATDPTFALRFRSQARDRQQVWRALDGVCTAEPGAARGHHHRGGG